MTQERIPYEEYKQLGNVLKEARAILMRHFLARKYQKILRIFDSLRALLDTEVFEDYPERDTAELIHTFYRQDERG